MRLFALCFISSFCFFTQIFFIKAEEPSAKGVPADQLSLKAGRTGQTIDTAVGKQLQPIIKNNQWIDGLAWSSDNKVLVLGFQYDHEDRMQVWKMTSGKPSRLIVRSGPELYHKSAKFFLTADGQTLVSGGRFGEAFVWDTPTGKKVRKLEGHNKYWLPVTMSQQGQLFAYDDQSYHIWDTKSGKKRHKIIPLEGSEGVTCTAFSPHERLLAIGLSTNKISVWRTDTGEIVRTFKGHSKRITQVAFNYDGSYLATGSEDHTAIVWESTTGKPIHKSEGHTGLITDVILNNNGKILFTASKDGKVKLWSTKTGKKLRTFEGHTRFSPGIALSKDGRHLITGTRHGAIKIWDVRSGKEVCQLMSFDQGKEWLVITPNGLFDGSPGALQYVSYRQPRTNKLIPLEKYQDKYYTSGLLPLVLAGKAPKVDTPTNRFLFAY